MLANMARIRVSVSLTYLVRAPAFAGLLKLFWPNLDVALVREINTTSQPCFFSVLQAELGNRH